MNKSRLKEIIKSAFTEIKVIRTMSNEEAYNKCLKILGPFQTFILTGDYDTLVDFMDNFHGMGIEEFGENFNLNYQEFEPIAKQAIQAVGVGDVKPLFLINLDDNNIGNLNYPISGFNSIAILHDNTFDYICGFLTKFPLKY
jgi:hypothetical protein